MDTARYRAFLMAADTGSIRNAAEILGYTSSGISQLIAALEDELNVKLLIRGKKGVSLTAAGEEIIGSVRDLVSEENHIMQLASDMNGVVTGTVNVAVYHSLASAWMPDVISTYQKKYPKVRVNIFVGTQQTIMDELRSKRSDIAFFNDSAMTGKYDWFPLLDDPMLAVVPVDHPMAKMTEFPIESFKGERFIMPEHGYDFDVLKILSEFDISPDVYLSTFDTMILLDMVGKGLGVSLINGSCLLGTQPNRRIKAIPIKPARSIQMGIALLSMKEASPAVRRFAETAKGIIENKKA